MHCVVLHCSDCHLFKFDNETILPMNKERNPNIDTTGEIVGLLRENNSALKENNRLLVEINEKLHKIAINTS